MRFLLFFLLFAFIPLAYSGHATYIEFLKLSPLVQKFEDETGTVRMTEEYLRETVDEMHSVGIDTIIIMYVEYQGFWFFPRDSYYDDYDTTIKNDIGVEVPRPGFYWRDGIFDPNVEDFNPLDVVLSQAEINGQKVFVGLGRNGDSKLIEDLFKDFLGVPVAPLFGLNLEQRLSLAVSKTQQIAYDINQAYGGYQSLAGWYLSHEISHLESGNRYIAEVTQGGVIPLRVFDKPILMSPADTLDLTSVSAGNSALLSGVDIIAPQDSVGPGYDVATKDYTYNQSIPIANARSLFLNWRTAIDIANNWLSANGNPRDQMQLWSNTEVWEMSGPDYEFDYPAKISRVVKQIDQYSDIVDKLSFNVWFGLVDSGENSLSPVQNQDRRNDVKDRAEGLYNFFKNLSLPD